MSESAPAIALLISIISIISAISYKFYRDSKKDHTMSGFDKGQLKTKMEHLKEELTHVKQLIQNIEDDVERGHMDYDSIQKQIADIRVNLARLEGSR